jgi:hypothetical protein
MNIVLAQLKKDAQCQRSPLILWVICLVLGLIPFAILAVLSHYHNSQLQFANLSDMQKITGVLSFVAIFTLCMLAAGFGMFLLLPVLVIRIVHEDTLIGTTAFWLTRPVPRQKLLLAKALFIAVLLLPLVLAGENSAHGGEGHFWPGETAWIAALAALAAITPGVQGLLGYGLALLFGKIIFSGIIDRLWNHYHGTDSVFSDGVLHFFSSTGHLFHLNAADFIHLCYLAGFAAVFIHQYLTLRTRKSLAIFVTTLVAVALLQMLAPPQPDTSTGPSLQINTSRSSNWQTP